MSLRSAIRGLLLGTAGALAAVGLAAVLSPQVRGRALRLAGRSREPEPEQATHIVLPDRAVASWQGLEEAIEEGRHEGSQVAEGDIALAGA
jgi:hypothetical protein